MSAETEVQPAGRMHPGMLAMLDEAPCPSEQHEDEHEGRATDARYHPETVRKALSVLDPEGRDGWLHRGMEMKSSGHPDAFEDWCAWSAGSPKFDRSECESVWASLKRKRGRTIASLYHEAQMWPPPPPAADEFGPIALPPGLLVNSSGGLLKAAAPAKFRPVSLADVQLHRETWIVKNLLARGDLIVLVGPPNVGKSFFAISLGCHIAEGAAFYGRRTCRAAVLCLVAEGGPGYLKRLVAVKRTRGIEDSAVPFFAVTAPLCLAGEQPDTDAVIAVAREVETAAGLPVGLIMVDTLARALGGVSENDSEGMGDLLRNVAAIQSATGAAVLLVAHTGKDAGKGIRGHSSLPAAADVVLMVSEGVVTIAKARDTERAAPMQFRLRTVNLGTDEDGDAITSCVVETAAQSDFSEPDPSAYATVIAKVQAHIRSGAQCTSRDLERTHGTTASPFGVSALRLREVLAQAVGCGDLIVRKIGRRPVLALPERGAAGFFDE